MSALMTKGHGKPIRTTKELQQPDKLSPEIQKLCDKARGRHTGPRWVWAQVYKDHPIHIRKQKVPTVQEMWDLMPFLRYKFTIPQFTNMYNTCPRPPRTPIEFHHHICTFPYPAIDPMHGTKATDTQDRTSIVTCQLPEAVPSLFESVLLSIKTNNTRRSAYHILNELIIGDTLPPRLRSIVQQMFGCQLLSKNTAYSKGWVKGPFHAARTTQNNLHILLNGQRK